MRNRTKINPLPKTAAALLKSQPRGAKAVEKNRFFF